MFETSLNNAGHGTLVKIYSNGASWYRIYSDSWCEQGGQFTQTTQGEKTITFHKAFKDTKYVFTSFGGTSTTARVFNAGYTEMSSSSIKIAIRYQSDNGAGSPTTTTVFWEAKGYV